MSYKSQYTYYLALELPALDVDAFLAGAFLAGAFDFFDEAFAVLFDVDASFTATFFPCFFKDPPCFSHRANSGK